MEFFPNSNSDEANPWDGTKGKPKEFLTADYSWSTSSNLLRPALINSYIRITGREFNLEVAKSEGYFVESPDGRLFHILQAPIFWDDGSKVKRDEKIAHRSLNNLLGDDVRAGGGLMGIVIDGSKLQNFMSTHYQEGKLVDCIVLGRFDPRYVISARGTYFQDEVSINGGKEPVQLESFSDCIFAKGINFQRAKFTKNFRLMRCRIDSSIAMFSCDFYNDLELNFLFNNKIDVSEALMPPKLTFNNCNFKEKFKLNHGLFSGEYFGFSNCIFESACSLNQMVIATDSWPKFYFSKCIFKGFVNFDSDTPMHPSAIRHCVFEKSFAYKKADFKNRRKQLLPDNDTLREENRTFMWGAVEKGAQELRVLAEKNNEMQLAWIYYDIENIARLNQQSSPNFIGNLTGRAYNFFSENGLSISKPISWLFATWVIFAMIYSSLCGLSLLQRGAVEFSLLSALLALKASASKMVILPFRSSDVYWQELTKTISEHHVWIMTSVEVLSFLQSLVSIILVFLAGLAIKRRYQF